MEKPTSILSKITLRAIVLISAIYTLIAIVLYMLVKGDVKISGAIDASQLVTAFLTIVSIAVGWLFGRRGG